MGENKQILPSEEKKEESKTNWSDVLNKAEQLADRIEKANQESTRILEQQQELAARNLLGGKTDAGEQQEKPKEETPLEYKDRILKGQL